MNSSIPKAKQKQYADYVKQITPTHSLPMNMAKAFLTGGVICVVGQIITNFAKSRGLDQDMAGTWCSVMRCDSFEQNPHRGKKSRQPNAGFQGRQACALPTFAHFL